MSSRVSTQSTVSSNSDKSQVSDANTVLSRADSFERHALKAEEERSDRLKVQFMDRVSTSTGRVEKLQDKEEFLRKMKKTNTVERQFRQFKKQYLSEKKFFNEKMKPSEDELVDAFVHELRIRSLRRQDLQNLFDKFRQLREVQLRLQNMEAIKLLRTLLGSNVTLAIQMIEFLREQVTFLDGIEKSDFLIPGISLADKEMIFKNIELDEDNEEECEKWVGYILFFSNPTNQWTRLKGRFDRIFLKFLDTSMIQAMVNNNVSTVMQLSKQKLPSFLKDHPEANLTHIQRADRSFSSFKKNSCPENCYGHRGKLLLLMIRMNHSTLVTHCIDNGIAVGSHCCTGQIKFLYWDIDRKQSGDKGDKQKKRQPTEKVSLRSQFTYETPLSTAVTIGNLEIVKMLMRKRANPLQAQDAAVKACVESVMARYDQQEKVATTGGGNNMITAITDADYILQLIIKEANNLVSKAKQRNGMLKPHYCTIVLVHQAAKEDLWKCVEILMKVRSKQKGVHDVFQETLVQSNIKNFLPPDKAQSDKLMGMFAKKTRKKRNPRTTQVTGGKAKSVMGSQFNTFRKKVRTSIFSGMGGTSNLISSAMSVTSHGTYIGNADGEQSFVGDMNEDICFIVLFVVDKFLMELLGKQCVHAATHANALLGVIEMIEKYVIYLDKPRLDCLIRGTINSMENYRTGDDIAILRVFNNRQVRHYLKFELDHSLESRKAELFIKHSHVKKLLSAQKKQLIAARKTWDKKHLKRESEEDSDERLADYNLLEVFLFQATRVGIDDIMVELHERGVEPDEEMLTRIIEQATADNSMIGVETLVELYGKPLLMAAFHAALSNSDPTVIEKVLMIDLKMKDDPYSLVEEYIGKSLLAREKKKKKEEVVKTIDPKRKKKQKRIKLEDAFTMEDALDASKYVTEQRAKKKKIADGKGEEIEEEEEEDDEANLPIEVVLDFFFVSTEMPKDQVIRILEKCFKNPKDIDFVAVAHLLAKASETHSGLVPPHLLQAYVDSRPVQFDDKLESIQVLWLRLLLDLYKIAVNTGGKAVEEQFNDTVVGLLELKPSQFTQDINYDDDDSVGSGFDIDDDDLEDMDDMDMLETSEYL